MLTLGADWHVRQARLARGEIRRIQSLKEMEGENQGSPATRDSGGKDSIFEAAIILWKRGHVYKTMYVRQVVHVEDGRHVVPCSETHVLHSTHLTALTSICDCVAN